MSGWFGSLGSHTERFVLKKNCWQYQRLGFSANPARMNLILINPNTSALGPVITAWPGWGGKTCCSTDLGATALPLAFDTLLSKRNLESTRPYWKLTSKSVFNLFWTILNNPHPQNSWSPHCTYTGSITRIFSCVYNRRHNLHYVFSSENKLLRKHLNLCKVS